MGLCYPKPPFTAAAAGTPFSSHCAPAGAGGRDVRAVCTSGRLRASALWVPVSSALVPRRVHTITERTFTPIPALCDLLTHTSPGSPFLVVWLKRENRVFGDEPAVTHWRPSRYWAWVWGGWGELVPSRLGRPAAGAAGCRRWGPGRPAPHRAGRSLRFDLPTQVTCFVYFSEALGNCFVSLVQDFSL